MFVFHTPSQLSITAHYVSFLIKHLKIQQSYLSPVRASQNLLGLYLKDYYRFEHETSWVYKISSRRSALHKNHNPPLPNFRVIALWYFSYLNLMSGRHIELYKEKFKRLLLLKPLMGFWPNSTGMVPEWSPT